MPTTMAAYAPLFWPVVPKSTAAPAPIALCTMTARGSAMGVEVLREAGWCGLVSGGEPPVSLAVELPFPEADVGLQKTA